MEKLSNGSVRSAAVAGRFYPEDADELKQQVRSLLTSKRTLFECPRLLICPHAGYVFSGPVAASAYNEISEKIKTVILIGPSHFLWFNGIAIPDVDYFETPLGNVPIDHERISRIKQSPLVHVLPDAHEKEHDLEVQLPFLQVKLKQFSIIPILTGDANPESIADLLLPSINDTTLVIASSDLSHYHSQDTARRLDNESIKTVLDAQVDGPIDGCGEVAIRVIMHLAHKMELSPVLLDSRTSFETAPEISSAGQVVGYAAVAYVGGFTDNSKKFLLNLARSTLDAAVIGKSVVMPDSIPCEVNQKRGCFVTLHKEGVLRGCIGYIDPIKPLYEAIIDNVKNAAMSDPRFSPVSENELSLIKIELSVLTNPTPIEFDTDKELLRKIVPFEDGILLQSGPYQSTFLPQVWEQLPDIISFLEHLSIKGGMGADGWKTATVKRYRVTHFEE